MGRLSVVIPQHGETPLTQAAVRTLLEHHADSPEVVIVDDGSPVAERRGCLRSLPAGVQVVRASLRRGVTAAWNQGAAATTGDVLIFLNNDTLTSGVWLPELAATLENGMALLAGVERRREPDLPAAFRRPAPQLLAGWCLALRRATFFELGGFDERFRLYFSDTDLQCRLLVQFGAEALLHVEELPVRHLGHRSTRRLTERSAIWRADRWQFLAKWNSQAAVLPADEEAGEP